MAGNQPLDKGAFQTIYKKRMEEYSSLFGKIGEANNVSKRTDAQVALIWTLIDNCRLHKSSKSGPSNMVAVTIQATYIELFAHGIMKITSLYLDQQT